MKTYCGNCKHYAADPGEDDRCNAPQNRERVSTDTYVCASFYMGWIDRPNEINLNRDCSYYLEKV